MAQREENRRLACTFAVLYHIMHKYNTNVKLILRNRRVDKIKKLVISFVFARLTT